MSSDVWQFTKLSGEDGRREDQKKLLYSVFINLISYLSSFLKMVNCGSLLKCALLAIVLAAVVESGLTGKIMLLINNVENLTGGFSCCEPFKMTFKKMFFSSIFSWEAGILL